MKATRIIPRKFFSKRVSMRRHSLSHPMSRSMTFRERYVSRSNSTTRCSRSCFALDGMTGVMPSSSRYSSIQSARYPLSAASFSGRVQVDRHCRLPTPAQAIKSSKRWRKLVVDWNSRGQHHIETLSRTDHWYRQGHGLVKVRWVYVRDMSGTHCAECLMSTDDSLSEREIVESSLAEPRKM